MSSCAPEIWCCLRQNVQLHAARRQPASRNLLHQCSAQRPERCGLLLAQVSSSIELPDLRIRGYALSRVGREHERRSQVPCLPAQPRIELHKACALRDESGLSSESCTKL